MSKLLSDEELGNLIDIAYKTATVGDSNGDKLTKDEFKGYMLATINTQKRLYAESVIGEDENNPAPREPCGASYRNQLRAEQRARINQ